MSMVKLIIVINSYHSSSKVKELCIPLAD